MPGPRAFLVLARLRPIHVAGYVPRTRWQPGDGSREEWEVGVPR